MKEYTCIQQRKQDPQVSRRQPWQTSVQQQQKQQQQQQRQQQRQQQHTQQYTALPVCHTRWITMRAALMT